MARQMVVIDPNSNFVKIKLYLISYRLERWLHFLFSGFEVF